MLRSRLLIVYCVVGAIAGVATVAWGGVAHSQIIQFVGCMLVALSGAAYRNAERIGRAFSEKQAGRLANESHRSS